MHQVVVYGALLGWVAGCVGASTGVRVGVIFTCFACVCASSAWVYVWEALGPDWAVEWTGRVLTVVSLFVGFFVWEGCTVSRLHVLFRCVALTAGVLCAFGSPGVEQGRWGQCSLRWVAAYGRARCSFRLRRSQWRVLG